VPLASGLGQNYPNPFNPETWIPYQIREEAEVGIAIYNARGDLIRNFNLGLKPVGYYTTSDKAVYWDGRNNGGEDVASGIYFYRLIAGSQTEIKKMIIIR